MIISHASSQVFMLMFNVVKVKLKQLTTNAKSVHHSTSQTIPYRPVSLFNKLQLVLLNSISTILDNAIIVLMVHHQIQVRHIVSHKLQQLLKFLYALTTKFLTAIMYVSLAHMVSHQTKLIHLAHLLTFLHLQ